MKLFRWFRPKPVPKKRPLSECVRESLRIVIYGAEPEVTDDEFESLYKDVLEAEVHGKQVEPIISNFFNERKHG